MSNGPALRDIDTDVLLRWLDVNRRIVATGRTFGETATAQSMLDRIERELTRRETEQGETR